MYRTEWLSSPNRASDCMGTYRHQNESLNSFVNRPKHISSHLQGLSRLKKPFMPHETWKPNFGKRTVHFYWTHVQSPGTRVCGSERPVNRLLTGRRVFKTTRSLPKYGSTFETEVVQKYLNDGYNNKYFLPFNYEIPYLHRNILAYENIPMLR